MWSVRCAALVLLVGALTGCRTGTIRLLSLFAAQQRPLSIALVEAQPIAPVQTLNPFADYRPLQDALTKALGRPVAVDVCFRFQAQAGLDSGWYDVLVMAPQDYAELGCAETVRVLAAPVDLAGRMARSAVLVVRAESALHTAQELKGREVVFGPVDDVRTHYAALAALEQAGVRREDLQLELLPVPGALRRLPDGRAVATAVLRGAAAAGFIDEATWESLPADGAGAGEPGRAGLRVILRTAAVPTRLIIAGPRLDERTCAQVQAFLLNVAAQRPDALRPLKISGYQAPDAEVLAACRTLHGAAESGATGQPKGADGAR